MNKSGYSVVIVEYFSDEHLFDCLKSVENQKLIPEKIVVVANGISKDTEQRLKDNYSKVHLINPAKNLGYSKAANLGIANIDSDFVLLLNPDVVLEQSCSEIAIEYLKNNTKVASVGPKILEPNGEIYPSARQEPNLVDAVGHALFGLFFPNNRFSKNYKNLNIDMSMPTKVDWLSGAVLFMRKSALDDVGGWDEEFFMYCEDIDLGRRFRKKYWYNVYLPECEVIHDQGGSSKKTPISLLIIHHKSLYRYVAKKYNGNLIAKIFALLFISIRLPLALAVRVFRL